MKTLIFLCAAFTAFASDASEPLIEAQHVSQACTYWHSSSANLRVTLENVDAAAERVDFVFGLNQTESELDAGSSWAVTNTLAMQRSAGGSWTLAPFSVLLRTRESRFSNEIAFAFRVTDAAGSVTWIKGNDSPLGHYWASLRSEDFPEASRGCAEAPGGPQTLAWYALPLSTIRK